MSAFGGSTAVVVLWYLWCYFLYRLFLLLKAFDYFPVAEISSSIGQGRRQKILADFKSGATRMLICSDQMARGMDVEGVTCVINYEPPRQFGIYLHRAGRTARAGQRGVVYTLLAKDEVSMLCDGALLIYNWYFLQLLISLTSWIEVPLSIQWNL